jgi:hypothetical protein
LPPNPNTTWPLSRFSAVRCSSVLGFAPGGSTGVVSTLRPLMLNPLSTWCASPVVLFHVSATA